MERADFEKELTKLPGRLHVRVVASRNKAKGFADGALQVWDYGIQSGRPYCVKYIVTQDGRYREPTMEDVREIGARDRARIAGVSRSSYMDTALAEQDARAQAAEDKAWGDADEWFVKECLPDFFRRRGVRKQISVGGLWLPPSARTK